MIDGVFLGPIHSPFHRPDLIPYSIQHAAAVERVILDRQEARRVRPVFEQSPFRQQLVQPFAPVIAQPAPQHQVRAARHDMDRIDLQDAHAAHRFENIGLDRWLVSGRGRGPVPPASPGGPSGVRSFP